MNFPKIDVPSMVVELHQIKPVLRAVLNTILFNRFLGLLKPRVNQSEIFEDIYYCSTSNSQVLQVVEAEIDKCFTKYLGQEENDFHLWLSFYDKKESIGIFSTATKKVYWERWHIRLKKQEIKSEQDRIAQHGKLSTTLKRTIAFILDKANDSNLQDHLPNFKDKNKKTGMPEVVYPFELDIPRRTKRWGSLRAILQSAPPVIL